VGAKVLLFSQTDKFSEEKMHLIRYFCVISQHVSENGSHSAPFFEVWRDTPHRRFIYERGGPTVVYHTASQDTQIKTKEAILPTHDLARS
jgi:hypothetical protein